MIPKFTPASACQHQPVVHISDRQGFENCKEVEVVIGPDLGPSSKVVRFRALGELSQYTFGISENQLAAISFKIPDRPVMYFLKDSCVLEVVVLACGLEDTLLPTPFMLPE